MINEILTASGVKFAQGRFLRMPDETHAVYFDDIEVDPADPVTADGLPAVITHDVTIELYEPVPDPDAEKAIEAQIIARGIPWNKQDRYWLKDLQRYQVVYDLTYYTKTRG